MRNATLTLHSEIADFHPLLPFYGFLLRHSSCVPRDTRTLFFHADFSTIHADNVSSGCDFHAPITRSVLEQNVYWGRDEERRGRRAERHVDVRQFDAHAIRQICRTASDSLRSNVYTSLSLSLCLSPLCCSLLPSFLFRAGKRAESERKVEILAEEEMEKYDNTIETASIMRTENGNGFGWWMERCLKRKKKKKKEKRWRFSEPISRLRFKQNVGRFFFEMEETLNKTFDLYIVPSLFSRLHSSQLPLVTQFAEK